MGVIIYEAIDPSSFVGDVNNFNTWVTQTTDPGQVHSDCQADAIIVSSGQLAGAILTDIEIGRPGHLDSLILGIQ